MNNAGEAYVMLPRPPQLPERVLVDSTTDEGEVLDY